MAARARRTEIDVTAAETAGLLAECDFGRPLHRLDLTITSLAGGGPERDRTQHLTFRSDPDGAGFVEDMIYRNLHPMLGKRLDLWRLSNFELDPAAVARGRLPLPRRRQGQPAATTGCSRWPRCAT